MTVHRDIVDVLGDVRTAVYAVSGGNSFVGRAVNDLDAAINEINAAYASVINPYPLPRQYMVLVTEPTAAVTYDLSLVRE